MTLNSTTLKNFLKTESASGVGLVFAAIVALVLANSPFAKFYGLLIDMPVEVRVGPLHVAKPLLLWINDGLMAVFFFLIGLELKREILEGSLQNLRQIALPAIGAIGGMLVPALIYVCINWDNSAALKGWAIPAATDIAFALAILMLLGDRVPVALKVFLVSLAIFDDVGAILIIAMFYSSDLNTAAMGVAATCVLLLFVLNRRGVAQFAPYILLGIVMWIAVLKSGVHATLTGAILASFIPMNDSKVAGRSPVREMAHDLHAAVAFGILPLFAFANSGIPLNGVGLDYLLHPVPLGIAAGLFVGKQLGVFAFCWLGVKLGLAGLPKGMTWRTLYGVSLLCGVGFTMSLFIGSLAFDETSSNLLFDERLGIIAGSLVSGIAGYLYLRRVFAN